MSKEVKIVVVLVFIISVIFVGILIHSRTESKEPPIFNIEDVDDCIVPAGTGSMLPLIHNDTLVCIKKTENVSVGDIIIFRLEDNGKVKRILHRVIAIEGDYYRTKGDNNGRADKYNVTIDMIEGKVRFAMFK